MFMKLFGIFNLLILLALLSGCASKSATGLVPDYDEQQKLIVTAQDMANLNQVGGDISDPHYLLTSAINKWDQQSYREAGNLLLNAYKAGKARGYQWHVSAKADLLTSALRAYDITGAYDQARYTAQFIEEEMSVQEMAFLSQESKTLIYLATMGGSRPLFKDDVPAKLRIGNRIN